MRYVSYLRNCTAYDHDFWYTCVKWCHQVLFFFIFLKFLFFRLLGGVKEQKTAQDDKKYLSAVADISGTINHMIIIKWWLSPGVLFHFFKILILWVVRQNDKKLCSLLFISQEPYITWSWFLVHMCKRTISPGIFHILSKF